MNAMLAAATSPVILGPADRDDTYRPLDNRCPVCGGSGEVPLGHLRRNLDGVLEPTDGWNRCTACAGTGDLSDDALVCEACEDVFCADEQVCEHGMTLCGHCRDECAECARQIGLDRVGDNPDDDPWARS